ncbi:MAG: VWA domain-containing protein [Pyrinomonadaceae bacterium]|nr:VWA domain-containing protein [Pyrinomonadaceae bacterium]
MSGSDRTEDSDGEMKEQAGASTQAPPLEEALRAARSATERRTLVGLARGLGKLPGDTARAAVETSAAIAGVSLRGSIEFLRAAPGAAQVIEAGELRAWGEMGRRLVMADVETGVSFFVAGVNQLKEVPPDARPLLFQICARQMTLSTSIALETFRRAPEVAQRVGDADVLYAIYEVILEVARRSAKHSAEFLAATPRAITSLQNLDANRAPEMMRAGVRLADLFAVRAGGLAADIWAALPEAIEGLKAEEAGALFRYAEEFLDRGGAAALHATIAGGAVMRLAPEAFDEWASLTRAVAAKSNASLVGLARISPEVFQALINQTKRERAVALARRAVAAAREVAGVDAEAAILCLRSAPSALRATTIEQFERWAHDGLRDDRGDARARRSYYALETRRSNDALQTGGDAAGLSLEDVAQTLRLYVEALTGRAIEVAPLAAVPDEARINDGRVIHLPSSVAEFADDALNFRLYKVLAAHAAGQIEFGTHERDTSDIRAAYNSLAELYALESADARDAFALDGYINRIQEGEGALAPEDEARRERAARRTLPRDGDYRAVLALFPQKGLATRIFGTLENGRVDHCLRRAYRGLARDLDLVRARLRDSRPRIITIPVTLVPFELLFQITLCGGALDDARSFYGQIVSELESIVADYLMPPSATVADTLMATSRVYSLFQSVVPEMTQQEQSEAESGGTDGQGGEDQKTEARQTAAPPPEQTTDARELFDAWARTESIGGDPDELSGAENWTQAESSAQDLEPGDVAFSYDEWDRELSDHRVGWCRVVEKRVRRGDRSFVDLARSRHRGVISSIRHQFQLMKPDDLKRIKNELDGDDYDLNAVIDYVADRRAARVGGAQPSERLYTQRLRRERDVSVALLLDQSSSTARTISRHPLQPYTYPGRRIIEIEKEGLVLMSEALEAVGDPYAVYGFTSEGRRNVRFYVIKDFDEHYSEEIERRIGGINYQHNTRLGAAVRHAAAKLQRQESRTRLLIVLSDGRPYDHDYGDARYAREDTREALRQARLDGITPFCITIDRDSEIELKDLYGEVGYTIIDDVLSLPERMPAIYRRLTT